MIAFPPVDVIQDVIILYRIQITKKRTLYTLRKHVISLKNDMNICSQISTSLMCGISSYIGKNCTENLINSIKQLLSRGYDSVGIAVIIDGKFHVHKYASTPTQTAIEKLEQEINKDPVMKSENFTVGICHSRWSTSGGKCDENSHPHLSMDGKICLVHNGIIHNYKEIKKHLISHGYTFKSETDTEVIVNLLCYNYKSTGETDIITAIKRTLAKLEGTWGLSILCSDYPNKIFSIRHGSPILISANDNFGMVVSEQSGFCDKVQHYNVLNNHDLCTMEYDVKTHEIATTTSEIYEDRKLTSNPTDSVNIHPHFTLKEILEQDDASLRAISFGGRIVKSVRVKLGGLDDNKKILSKITNIILLGCGTSYHAGMIGTHYFKDLCIFNTVQCIDAAEFSEKDIPRVGNTAFILLSQSGETKDLYTCLEIGKKNNIFLIGVINVIDSMIAREVNCGCYLNAGREIAVASTKSFTSQVIILSMIAIWFAQLKGVNIEKRKNYIADLRNLNVDIKNTLTNSREKVKNFLPLFEARHSCFVLGKGKAEAVAMEVALKIKELSLIHAEGYSLSSLKHGPFALLTDNYPVIMIAPKNSEYQKAKNAYQEVSARNAKIIYVTDDIESDNENTLVIPHNSTYAELLATIPLQFLSYYLALNKGINPDMPRNLAKVVTVD